MEEDIGASFMNAREYSRVDAFIPMDVRMLLPGELDGIRSRITRKAYLAIEIVKEEVDDPVLSEWLKMLNAKLDFIINTLKETDKDISSLPYRLVNISAGGLNFVSRVPYNKGDVLEVRMVLYLRDPVNLCFYGEVLRSRKRADEYDVALKYILMDDELREELVKYVFEKQREILRGKRK